MKSGSEKKSMDEYFILILIGLVGGTLSGLVGLGGGVIIVPALVIFVGFNQALAQGTTLAMMVPPIGILAVLNYYNRGHVDFRVAAILCVGFFVGGFLGSAMAVRMDQHLLRKIFSIVLVLIAAKMFFTK